MKSIAIVILMTGALYAGGIPGIWPPQPMPGEAHTVTESSLVDDLIIHAEQRAHNVRVFIDPVNLPPSPQYFVLTRDGVIMWVDHFSRMYNPAPNGHFGTPDELFMDAWVPQGEPDSELPHDFKVYHTTIAPDFSQPSILVNANTQPASSASVQLVDWEILQDDILILEGGDATSTMSVRADDACRLMGVSFSWTFDADKVEMVGVSNSFEWDPTFSSFFVFNEPTTNDAGEVQPAGVAYYGSIRTFFDPLNATLAVLPGQEVPILTMLLQAKPGAPVGEVDYDLRDYWHNSGEIVMTQARSAYTEVVYYDHSLGPAAMTHYDIQDGEQRFSRWQKPFVSIGELPSLTTAGDCNQDGSRDLTDAVGMLGHLFAGQSVPCVAAIDMDANGVLNITDPLSLLSHLFLGGPAPFECDLEATGCGGAWCP